ncbi:hypothetical protein A6R68_00392 [Neotoma lepida]|uniref:Uncharacterized protein n=1 Tax=Neotoma lepida TaxID=56216 RepID=A0A1A6GXK2_NEOLE|nr:hypothetical protein A6R68_00392 [Neotoma lepida]
MGHGARHLVWRAGYAMGYGGEPDFSKDDPLSRFHKALGNLFWKPSLSTPGNPGRLAESRGAGQQRPQQRLEERRGPPPPHTAPGTMSGCEGGKKKPLKQPKKQVKEMDKEGLWSREEGLGLGELFRRGEPQTISNLCNSRNRIWLKALMMAEPEKDILGGVYYWEGVIMKSFIGTMDGKQPGSLMGMNTCLGLKMGNSRPPTPLVHNGGTDGGIRKHVIWGVTLSKA